MDGRPLLEYRKPLAVEYGVTNTAEGSAKVTIGDTVVIAGVKMSVEKPYPDQPDMGTIMVGTELLPLSNSEFEPGPPSILAIELSRVADRGIRESKAVDFKKLCITAGEKVWVLSIDICPVNASGNLFDASTFAAVAALKAARYPAYDGKAIDYKDLTEKSVDLLYTPVACTVYLIGSYLVVDPSAEEETLTDARLTVTFTEKGEICSLQKGGPEALTEEQILAMVEIARQKTEELRNIL